MIQLYFNESNGGRNRGNVHENYNPDAYKYQPQFRWQPSVISMCHIGTCEGYICGSSSVNLHQPGTVFSSRAPGFW